MAGPKPIDGGERCSGCGAPIWWAETRKGSPIPVDVQPEMRIVAVDTGAIMHGQEPYDLGELRAEVTDRGGTPRVLSLPTFTPHHATCPNAESFRGPRS